MTVSGNYAKSKRVCPIRIILSAQSWQLKMIAIAQLELSQRMPSSFRKVQKIMDLLLLGYVCQGTLQSMDLFVFLAHKAAQDAHQYMMESAVQNLEVTVLNLTLWTSKTSMILFAVQALSEYGRQHHSGLIGRRCFARIIAPMPQIIHIMLNGNLEEKDPVEIFVLGNVMQDSIRMEQLSAFPALRQRVQ
jgi:hypothetical protein